MTATPVEGGWRERLIFNEFCGWLHTALEALNRFGPLHQSDGEGGRIDLPPITWRTKPFAADETIPVNTLVVSTGTIDDDPAEIGSGATIDGISVWIDFYGANDDLAKQITGDIRSILLGKYRSIGYTYGGFAVTEQRPEHARPDGSNIGDELFWIEIEDVQREHAIDPVRPELRHWYSVTATLTDENDS